VHCVAFNSDGTKAISGDQEDAALLWDVKSGKVERVLEGHKDTVIACGWSADQKEFATASMDGTIRIYKKKKVLVIEGPDSDLLWFQWHKKGPVVIAGCADGTVWMWHTKSGRCMQVLSGHADAVICGTFSGDGKLVVSGSVDQKVIVWSPKSGQPIHKLQAKNQRGFHLAPITCVAAHHSKGMMVTGAEDGTAWLCSLSKNSSKPLKELKDHKQSVEAAEFSKCLNWVFTASSDGTIIVSDIATGALRTKVELQGAVIRAMWNPVEPTIIAAGTDTVLSVWDARNGKCLREMRGHSDSILALAVSKDGKLALTGADDSTCAIFQLMGSEKKEMSGKTDGQLIKEGEEKKSST